MADKEVIPQVPKSTGRKFTLSLLSLGLVTIGFVLTGFLTKVGDFYGTFVMAITSILGVFSGADVGHKWVLAKHGVLTNSKEEVNEELEQDLQNKEEPKAKS